MKFGQKLKRLRKQKGYTQAELAKNAGMSLRTIIYYEKGESYPRSRETYKILADILETDVNYLITEDEGDINLIKRTKWTEKIVGEIRELFASKNVSKEEKEKLMLDVEKLFLDIRCESLSNQDKTK